MRHNESSIINSGTSQSELCNRARYALERPLLPESSAAVWPHDGRVVIALPAARERTHPGYPSRDGLSSNDLICCAGSATLELPLFQPALERFRAAMAIEFEKMRAAMRAELRAQVPPGRKVHFHAARMQLLIQLSI